MADVKALCNVRGRIVDYHGLAFTDGIDRDQIAGSVADSMISGVINTNSETPTIQCDSGWENVSNLQWSCLMPETTNQEA